MQGKGLAQVDNCTVRAILVASERLSVRPQAFMTCVSISSKKAGEVIGKNAPKRISDKTTTLSIRLAEIKKAAQTGKVKQAA